MFPLYHKAVAPLLNNLGQANDFSSPELLACARLFKDDGLYSIDGLVFGLKTTWGKTKGAKGKRDVSLVKPVKGQGAPRVMFVTSDSIDPTCFLSGNRCPEGAGPSPEPVEPVRSVEPKESVRPKEYVEPMEPVRLRSVRPVKPERLGSKAMEKDWFKAHTIVRPGHLIFTIPTESEVRRFLQGTSA